MVTLSKHTATGKNAKVQFDRVDRNDGQGYSVKTGIFTSPVAGMYHFFWNILSASSGEYTVELIMNGQIKISSHAAGRAYATPSASIYLRMKKGDEVYLRTDRSGGMVHSQKYSTFGGELIRY